MNLVDAYQSIGQLEHVVTEGDDDKLRVLRAVLNGKLLAIL